MRERSGIWNPASERYLLADKVSLNAVRYKPHSYDQTSLRFLFVCFYLCDHSELVKLSVGVFKASSAEGEIGQTLVLMGGIGQNSFGTVFALTWSESLQKWVGLVRIPARVGGIDSGSRVHDWSNFLLDQAELVKFCSGSGWDWSNFLW